MARRTDETVGARKGAQLAGLLGRSTERATVDHLISLAGSGRSGTIVVRGEAGIGKTALLEHARATAHTSGFRVEASAGVESESQFAFAGLHQLCAPLLDHVEALPEPQRSALGVAFGLRRGDAPDRFLVGLATLNLLAEGSERSPLLCLVDDAQWLDEASAQVLAFVARRLDAERVALLFAVRDARPGDTQTEHAVFTGLPELHLGGLDDTDSRILIASALRTPVDASVLDRIIAESHGNPLALLELPLSGQPADWAGGFELPGVLDVPRRVEESFHHRSRSLPDDTQLLLVVAAAEPTGDADLLWRAVEGLGMTRRSADPAEAAGLLHIDTRVRFRHPLVRSAVYRAASRHAQRRAHRALADATDAGAEPDRRAWHRALSAHGTDDEIAGELERAATSAHARGGLSAAAAFLQRSAELSSQPAQRASRALEAAHAKHVAGSPEAALALLAVAELGPLDDLQRARLELLRARVSFYLTRGSDVPHMALAAARTLAPLDAKLSRETYLDALEASTLIGGRHHFRDIVEVAEAARHAPPMPQAPTPADLLLQGLVTMFAEGYDESVPELRRALEAYGNEPPSAQRSRRGGSDRWLWLASRSAAALFEDDLVHLLDERNVRLAREAGALAALPAALVSQSSTLVISGDFANAAVLAAEASEIAHATGAAPLRYAELFLAAWRGDHGGAIDLHAAIIETSAEGVEAAMAHYALAVLHNGAGRYAAAGEAASRSRANDELTSVSLALPELIEAASRAGEPDVAGAALDELRSRARASSTPWALGLVARSHALVSTGAEADRLYRDAIELLRQCRVVTHLARTHLVYGEWLRREGRRSDAREQLTAAHDLLTTMGADGYALRAAQELRATGDQPRKRIPQAADALTAHELHIARLVADGATSREVAGQLFLSPRTIDAHLRNIFRKLDIASRRQLRGLQLP